MQKKLILLSGPSCVGKTPLLKMLARIKPEMHWGKIILYNSRAPRPVETDGVDYFFRSEEEIRNLPENRYIVAKTRSVWQAVDIENVLQVFSTENLIILEIYPTFGAVFLNHQVFKKYLQQFFIRTIFLAPLTWDEVEDLVQYSGFDSAQEAVTSVMLPKLIGRSLQQGKLLSKKEMDDLQIRASKAYDEMIMGKEYTDYIVNHDGEDSTHWKCVPPIGDAGKTLKKVISIITDDA